MKKEEKHLLKMQFQYSPEKQVEVVQVIRTTLTMRGEGKDKDPIRQIEQYWSLAGELLWENDPCKKKRTPKKDYILGE